MYNKPFRVLSLDGGGMRGLYTASALNTLSQRYSGENKKIDIGSHFDLVVGTSTGGILAMAIAAGIDIDQVIDLYQRKGPTIFQCPTPNNKFLKFLWSIWNLLTPANTNVELKNALSDVFKTETVGDLYARRKIGVCLASVNMATHKSRVFKTAHNPKKNLDDKRTLVDICLASAAAPIIFPVAGIPDSEVANSLEHFVDGGLWANNPILIALVEALELTEPDRPVEILSIGTCPPPGGEALLPSEATRGVLDWSFGIKALEVSMDAQASGYEYISNFLAKHFSSLNKSIEILRLNQTAPSCEQANFLGLDKASDKACATLIQLGAHDAREAYGKAQNGDAKYQLLNNIFNKR